METEDLRKKIRDAVTLLENYRGFGPMVGDGIDALNRIDACVAEPTEERVAEAKSLLESLNREIGPYQSYVPTVALALQELNEWAKTV
jgi:predicted translin family RNA/ssDNA-binding protein